VSALIQLSWLHAKQWWLRLAGLDFSILGDLFGVSASVADSTVKELLSAIILCDPLQVRFPTAQEEYAAIAREFSLHHSGHSHFTNIIGAVDGSFVFVRVSLGVKSPLFGYKWPVPCLLLLIIADSNFCIRWFDISHPASWGDRAVFADSDLRVLQHDPALVQLREELDIPDWTSLPREMDADDGSSFTRSAVQAVKKALHDKFFFVPDGYLLVADGGFTFSPQVLTPGGRRARKAITTACQRNQLSHHLNNNLALSNYLDFTISRMRICVEQTFGILMRTWRVLRCGKYDTKLTKAATKACIIFHNFRRQHESSTPPTSPVLLSQCLQEVEPDEAPGTGVPPEDTSGGGVSVEVTGKEHPFRRKLARALYETRTRRVQKRFAEGDDSSAKRVCESSD
jgi:hypothetical protein